MFQLFLAQFLSLPVPDGDICLCSSIILSFCHLGKYSGHWVLLFSFVIKNGCLLQLEKCYWVVRLHQNNEAVRLKTKTTSWKILKTSIQLKRTASHNPVILISVWPTLFTLFFSHPIHCRHENIDKSSLKFCCKW